MILESITLRDFGVYGGEQRAELAPVSRQKPIVLFGGMNGGGKTTLLDAVQLGLYGPKARCAGRGKLGYRDYLQAMIHRGVPATTGASIELEFRRMVEGETRQHRLVRSWRDTGKGIADTVQVFTNSYLDNDLSEHWDEFIEGYIPSGIAHLFFFDAEQIKELAEGEHAAEILGTAIHTLLGLDLVDQLETDLIVLERRKRTEARSAEEVSQVDGARQEVSRMQQLLDEAQVERGTLGNEVGRLSKEVADAEQRFRREGGELFLVRAELEEERDQLVAELSRQEGALRELAAGAAPLLLIPGLLEEAEQLVHRDRETRHSHLLSEVLAERDAVLLRTLTKAGLPAKYATLIGSTLAEDRDRRQSASGEVIFEGADDQLAGEFRHLRSTVLPETRRAIQQRLDSLSGLQERLTRLEMELARVPAEEAIAGLQGELDRLRQRHQQSQATLAAQDDKIQLLIRQLDDADRRYKRVLGEGVEVELDREHFGRLLQHSARMRNTLGKFRVAAIRKHTTRLERLILESFAQLLRKTSLVTGLAVDPSTFRLELTGGDGQPLPFGRLSAGERQLLATSILWGLAKASGRPLPTIIDTPLGRLDSSHRRHLLERYFPVASHQVILLSTDEEIDETSLKHLQRYVGREYQLTFNESSRSTEISKGYFWNHETTR
jgi:DNA sulfur modification protein DndD